MNAQEAINRIERMLGNYSEKIGELQRKANQPERVEEAISLYEALSIVLETAKIFHSGEPEAGPHHYYFEGWHVRKDKLNEIGVLLEGQTNLFNEEVEE